MTRIMVAVRFFGKHRGQPFGSETWQAEVAARLGLESLLRPRGRPRKQSNNGSWSLCALLTPLCAVESPAQDVDITAQRTGMSSAHDPDFDPEAVSIRTTMHRIE